MKVWVDLDDREIFLKDLHGQPTTLFHLGQTLGHLTHLSWCITDSQYTAREHLDTLPIIQGMSGTNIAYKIRDLLKKKEVIT